MASAYLPHRPRTAPRPSAVSQPTWPELLFAFLLPITSYATINVGGKLFGQDLLAFGLLPFLLSRRGSTTRLKPLNTVLLLLVLWLFAQIVTDLIRGSASEDYLRGWSKILFFGVQLTTLWLLLSRRWSMFIAYMLGSGIYAMISVRHLDPPYSEFPWKFGLGFGVILAAAAVGSIIGMRRRGLFTLAAPALISLAGLLVLFKGGRSLFGGALMAVLYIIVCGFVSSRPKLARSITPAKFLIFVAGGVLAAQLLVSGYALLATNGVLGDEARAKYEDQQRGGNIIEGGRLEIIVSTQAVADSPIIGHGSWAHDMSYVRLLYRRSIEAGVKAGGNMEGRSDLIPTHSHLLGAWVEAGFVGAIFWAYVIWLCMVGLYRMLLDHRLPSPVVALTTFTMLWDIIFSPFGADQRFLRAAEIAILLYVLEVTSSSRQAMIGASARAGRALVRARPVNAVSHTRGRRVATLPRG